MSKIYVTHLTILLLLFNALAALGQGENNQWHFGRGHHMDFNNSPPTYDTNSNIVTSEGSATVSDAQGNLIFYTMGCRIWDRNGNEMPNATGLLGNGPANSGFVGSGRESVQILPNPGNANQFYVFSASDAEDGLDTLFYHIVDMSLNGGLGDVIPASKNTVLFDAGYFGLTEITATAYGDCNTYWYIVATGTPQNGDILAFKVDEDGVSTTPVRSIVGINYMADMYISNMSPIAYFAVHQGVVRSSFNKSTGVFNNFEMLINNFGDSHIALSPNEQVLYRATPYSLTQYNLQPYPDTTAIAASVVTLLPLANLGDIRLGPDNKIYMPQAFLNAYMSRIEQPNVLGTGCMFIPQYMSIPNQISYYASFGPPARIRTHRDTIFSKTMPAFPCSSSGLQLSSTHPNITSYRWNNGNTSSQQTVSQPGIYWVEARSSDCKLYIDSFIVQYPNMTSFLGADTLICTGQPLILNAYPPDADAYTWSDASTGATLAVTAAGTYYVTAKEGNCTFYDTIKVDMVSPAIAILQADTTICSGSSIMVTAATNMNSTIYWNTGQTGSSVSATKAGPYIAATQNICGIQSDTLLLTEVNCDCLPMVPNTFTPNKDGRNDVFMPLFRGTCETKFYELHIYNRYGQLVFSSFQKDKGWDGNYQNNKSADPGVYFYMVKVISRYGAEDKSLIFKGDITLIR
ncbi:gliding motility-associated C-terminal domain-containing protein [Taibaiella sp. KBW10]|uniref:T9SS type B sorting domain-containing protein n=1 Tax=Taibaiella sp. KBW10 TaxID=2153357 RepID=UPI0013159C8E|nr:gliding motility-associated C-terminal domain-containing protein [Taibaiella sp. KBW10]